MPKKYSNHSTHHSEVHTGPREDMLALRAKQLKELRKKIDEVLKDWDGSPLFMATTKDEGEHTATQALSLGVGDYFEEVALQKALAEGQKQLAQQVNSVAPDSGDILSQLMDSLKTAK